MSPKLSNFKCVFQGNYSCDMGGKSKAKAGTQGWERTRTEESKESGILAYFYQRKESLCAEEGNVSPENVKSAKVLAL